jgi:hypothetical protein
MNMHSKCDAEMRRGYSMGSGATWLLNCYVLASRRGKGLSVSVDRRKVIRFPQSYLLEIFRTTRRTLRGWHHKIVLAGFLKPTRGSYRLKMSAELAQVILSSIYGLTFCSLKDKHNGTTA